MNPTSLRSRARQQRELDQEQTLVVLDQSIAEREQARADRDQQRLDEAQLALDAHSPAADEDDFAALDSVNQRQVELGLAQDRSDAHQTQLDDNQRAHDLRRNVLDEQQTPLDQPADTTAIISEVLAAPVQARDQAELVRRHDVVKMTLRHVDMTVPGDWCWGERWLMRLLLDGDQASNNGNWQWIASVGVDPQPPYRRIYNPVRQQLRFDPQGTYVHRYLPELRAVPDEYLAEPWKMPAEVQQRAGCAIGRDYPAPIVDHAHARRWRATRR